MAVNGNKKRKVKYRKITFKLSDKQKAILQRCSEYENTTPNKFIKSAIEQKVKQYADRLAEEDANQVSENQLELFDFNKIGKQVSLFD